MFFVIFKKIKRSGGVVSKPPYVLLVYRHRAVTDVVSEQSGWLNAAQTGSDSSPHLCLWHRPRNDKAPPGQRRGTHLQRQTFVSL